MLNPTHHSHAKELYPLITDKVTATIQWDGPTSFEDFEEALRVKEIAVRNKEIYQFTIMHPDFQQPIGSISIRPDESMFRADIGLWIGEKYHGQGLGTKAIRAITNFGFKELKLSKIEGNIFVGNIASRRIFEKCGYQLEGTIRHKVIKRGKPVDEWLFGILLEEWNE